MSNDPRRGVDNFCAMHYGFRAVSRFAHIVHSPYDYDVILPLGTPDRIRVRDNLQSSATREV